MRLSTIKLSGFKSFVDPTVLHLPANMTGVVGPNGCGKSNIIDAVRWVMGESSASRLRGDNLTDVIFSGSSARKPVSQAMVELVFDNSDGLITGEYASFNEISVKRVVSRDGQSAYYLNGTRCRRRDITDLFLGTGLGPRSYSIIEQGMISQIVEARPEDLRIHLEEAAGISKYKERRKETETRIRHTRENLDRLNDVREEVDKQLEHLKRQARQAETYQALKAEQREKDAQLKALRHRRLHASLLDLREAIAQDATRLEASLADLRQAEAQLELCRVQREEAQEHLATVQAESYRVGGEIARLEQQIQHQRELRDRLERARIETETAAAEVGRHIGDDRTQLALVEALLDEADPKLESLQLQEDATNEALRQAEQAVQAWQGAFDAAQRDAAEATRAAEVDRTRIDYLERQALDAQRRIEALQGERAQLDVESLAVQIEQLRIEHETRQASLDTLGEALEARRGDVTAVQAQQSQAQSELADVRKRAQAARGRLASLEALQHAAMGQEKGAALEWVRAHGLESARRVVELLDVDPGWETAVETVLGTLLQGVVVDDSAALAEALATLPDGRLALVEAGDGAQVDAPGTLAARVRGPAVVRRLLARVRPLDDLAQLRAQSAALAAGEWLVTRDGECFGDGWASVTRSGEAQRGALVREREIQSLREDIAQLGRDEAALQARIEHLRGALLEAEQRREDAQRALYLAHRSVSELGGELQSRQGQLASAQARHARIEDDLAQQRRALDEATRGASDVRTRLEITIERMDGIEQQRDTLEHQRQALLEARESARARAREAREAVHALALSLESARTRREALRQALERMDSQESQLRTRRAEIEAQLADGDTPIRQLQDERQASLALRVDVERNLSAARSALDGIDAEMRRYEQLRQRADQQAQALRDTMGQRRLEEQALALKEQALAEGIVALGITLEEALGALPESANPDAWEKSLAELEVRIRRLEPVNLAAIQEHADLAQRKAYLDAQFADLTAALETLDSAIRKIDRETRGRFKDTFDRVNSGLQELYPRLFGGGHAYLELTGEDLLDTGVAIMARPPGKRVTNISLLSGGEKALTAVALVFAIFRLNPAPFCMLDEVDAPLDEANVGRFCTMVKEMSERVQFLFVTHNKATMEAASQLAGVTMREPGVSRLVSVDLAEAARLAGAA